MEILMPAANATPNNPAPTSSAPGVSQDDVSRFMSVGGDSSPEAAQQVSGPAAQGPAQPADDAARFARVGELGQQQDQMDAEAARDAQNSGQPGFVSRFAQTSGASALMDAATNFLHNLSPSHIVAQAQSDFQQNLQARDAAVAQLKAGDLTGAARTLVGHLAKRAASITPGASTVANIAESTVQHGKQAVQSAEQGDTAGAVENAAAAVPVLGQVGEAVGKPLGEDLGKGNYAGVAGDVVGPIVAAVVGELAGRGLLGAGARTAEGAESALPEVSGADVKAQAVKDAIRKSLGSKADADVVQEAYGRMQPQNVFDKMVSPTENELKLVKPRVAADLNVMNSRLNNMLADSGAQVENAATKVSQSFDDLLDKAKAGVGDAKEAQTAIDAVRERVLGKLTDDPTDVTAINDLKRAVGDQIKSFQPPEMMNSAAKTEAEAYRQAYFKLRDLVSDAVPESRDLNMRISRAFDLQDLLEKKFPQLETPEQAAASYKGVRNAGKLKLAGKAAVGLGLADEVRRVANSIEGGR
jgi:hypothetical protein